ncbi:peroxidase 43-like [Sesamum indicum]|uniref:Peroxidase n=1 Tax=Sesamum indicum TaxID=4182 RepID=A0A6I9TVS7_SESIN|nr:peroxidase 43-like [Sesamum indicum]
MMIQPEMERCLILMNIVVLMISCCSASHHEGGKLRVGFYAKSCPKAESIVRGVVQQAVAADQNNAPVLLRLHFHDCFVQGCDGSILIDKGSATDEKHAFGHQGVGGFDVIERAKAEVEAVCPGLVSCADILALAARDAVALAKGPRYEVETGRRDGVVSDVRLADNMPDVADSIHNLRAKFSRKGLSDKDLVLLSAAHTIGTTACFFMTQRLYQFPATGGSDPSINPDFLQELKSTCPRNGDANVRLPMDRGSAETFDNQILKNIRSGFAVLQSDASLYQDKATKGVIDSYLGPRSSSFEADFAASMVKMGRIGVLTGSRGTIRRVCSSFN